jgi:hypothetical protein
MSAFVNFFRLTLLAGLALIVWFAYFNTQVEQRERRSPGMSG